jgi:hypothetical protein
LDSFNLRRKQAKDKTGTIMDMENDTTAQKVERDDADPDNNNRAYNFDIPMADTTTVVTTASTTTSSNAGHDQNEDERKDEGEDATIARSTTSLDWKNEGNDFVKKKDWENALHAYRSGLSALLLQTSHILNDDDKSSISFSLSHDTSTSTSLEVALRSNIAFVHLKLHHYQLAEEECNQILSISPSNSKGTYRNNFSRLIDRPVLDFD